MAQRPPRRAIDGVLLLDKPAGITSQRAVARVKALTGAAKVGHTGTLDPIATGLLPLAFGEATKFSHALLDADKSYVAVVQLGVATATGDIEGEIIRREPVTAGRGDVERVLERFGGESDQTPPMYSALKVAGKPLYAYARAGVELARASRRIRIPALELTEHAGDRFTMRVDCSKGTYIRVLAHDIGEALGCGATLAALRRTRVGRFGVDDAIGLSAFEMLDEIERLALLAPADTLVQDLPRVDLDAEEAARLIRGQAIAHGAEHGGLLRVYGPDAAFLGVAETSGPERIVPRRLIATNVQNS